MKNKIIIGVVLLAVVLVVVFSMKRGHKEIHLNTVIVEEGVVEQTVTATGYVQPVDKVDVGTQVSGVIERIYVDFNSSVKKGQLLAELDKLTLTEKLTQTKASLLSAESDLIYAQQNYDRVKQLYDAKAATRTSYEDVVNRLAQAKTAVVNAKATVHQAEVNLSYADIYSPIDGVVLNRAVEQGQTVAASFNTPTLFTIAHDLKKMQVEANVDEADIGQIRLGQSVTFTVDAYSSDLFEGTVQQIRLQPTVTSNVVTYTVIIEAPNPEEKLFPGMTANVKVITQAGKGLVIPMEALRFNPSQELMTELKASHQEVDKTEKGVWVEASGSITRHALKTGISDGIHVIVSGGLSKGDKIVLSVLTDEKKEKKPTAAANPLMPRRHNR